jgi:hypothetical protein
MYAGRGAPPGFAMLFAGAMASVNNFRPISADNTHTAPFFAGRT